MSVVFISGDSKLHPLQNSPKILPTLRNLSTEWHSETDYKYRLYHGGCYFDTFEILTFVYERCRRSTVDNSFIPFDENFMQRKTKL